MVSVKTETPVPKDKIFEAMRLIRAKSVCAPVKIGDMSNVKYSFPEKYHAEQKLICNYIQIKENDIRFSYQDAGIEKILSDICC